MECNNQTIRYIVSVAALSALGLGALNIDGEIGMTIAVAIAGAIGYMAKDWRSGGVADAEEIQESS